MELKTILENKQCFKLICGAGNKDSEEIEKLAAIYASANANLIDLSADKEILSAAISGLNKASIKNSTKLCVSIGTKDDPHMQKACIDSKMCTKCELCVKACPNFAITKEVHITKKRCIGCAKCASVCNSKAITFQPEVLPTEKILDSLDAFEIDCIELHSSLENKGEFLEIWETLNKNFNGMLSLCISRTKTTTEEYLNTIKQALAIRKPFTTIIQADGIPMSGSQDTYKATLQAIASSEIIHNLNLPVYLIPSGGTNSKTAKLAYQCGINIHGVAVGSFARNYMRNYINQKTLFENQTLYSEAIKEASKLTEMVLSDLKNQ